MKYAATLILIVILAGAGAFGAIAMGPHANGAPCAASVLDGSACPENNTLFAIHHISAYEHLSRAAPVFVSVSLILLLLIILALSRSPSVLVAKPTLRPLKLFKEKQRPRIKDAVIQWLALFENSPSLI